MNVSLEYLNRLYKKCFHKLLQFITLSTTSIGIIVAIEPHALAFSLTGIDGTGATDKTGFDHESIDIISDVLYARPSSTYSLMDANGAYRTNRDYALGDTSKWYIETQRFGADALIAGLLHNDPRAIDAGLMMFDWGFAQQLSDGSFGSTDDPFHSTSLFVQSVAYGLLTLQESPSTQYLDVVEHYLPALHSAARWMIREDVWSRGLSNNNPYTHRNYIVGTALGLTGKLTGDSELLNYSDSIIAQGLTLQHSDGVNPEKGGHDTSYQMSGALMAMRWLNHFDANPLAGDMTRMINQALQWEESMILSTGEINTEGNTRTNNQELNRSEQRKQVNHREVIQGFAYWSSMTDDQRWYGNAYQVANYYYVHDSKVNLILASISDQSDIAAQLFSSKSNVSESSLPIPETSYPVGLAIFLSVGLFYVGQHKKLQP